MFVYEEDTLSFRNDELCMDASAASADIKLFACHRQGGNQAWFYEVSIRKTQTFDTKNNLMSSHS